MEETDQDDTLIKGFIQYCIQTGVGGAQWSTVCIDPYSSQANEDMARVACRQLGFSDLLLQSFLGVTQHTSTHCIPFFLHNN